MKTCSLIVIVVSSILSCTDSGHGMNFRLSQPQIYIDDGHLYIVPAEHRNLVLVANGTGKIVFNAVELDAITGGIKNITKEQRLIRRIFGNPSNISNVGVARRLRRLEQRVRQLDQFDAIDGRLAALEQRLAAQNASSSDTGGGQGDQTEQQQQDTTATPRGLRRRIVSLERRVRDLTARNPCGSSPCQNAGTCIPTIFGPFCNCQPGWEGDRCQIDVNECAAFLGSGLGCQNGATCVNTPGSYTCNCNSGYAGVHCTLRSGDCSSGAPWELCGHGVCVNQQSGSRPYFCICDQGWKTDGTNPACNIDIDECNAPHAACSVNPPVTCVNTPGSFHCGQCPPGYTGNGYQCSDVNECLQNNGGCSTNPYVQCINTIGSRTCSECPPGFMGDGVNCQYVGMCQINNGGCYPLARCVQNAAIGQSYVQCICPPGFTGTGMGSQGCYPFSGGTEVGPAGNPCSTNPCVHGTCAVNGNTYVCNCQLGFTGPTCALRADPCLSAPCQNGGTCTSSSSSSTSTSSTFVCRCPNDFTGLQCEIQEEACGGSIRNVEGTLKYPPDSSQAYGHNKNCMWTVSTQAGKVLNLTFTRFHLEGGAPCAFDWLQINDGYDSTAPLIGKFCGDELPKGGTILTTHEVIFLWFRSDHSTTGLGFEFTWNSTDPVCGGNIEGQTHGAISSPGYPVYYPHNRDCLWTITVAYPKRIQLVFATVQLEVHANCSYDYLLVQDGYGEDAPVLAMYCNRTLPPPLTSSGPYLRLLFHTDESATDTGFHVTFAEVPGVPGCGGVFTESQGVFASPQHPEPYAHGLDCEYLIRLASPDEKITVSFTEFELEGGSTCPFDFVEIRDGGRPDSPLIGRFCERNRPPVITSTANFLLIRFRSDHSVTSGGWRAKYESLCGGTFSTDTGILRSPFYPLPYPHNRDCVYIIAQPVSKAIQLDFTEFDIEGGSGGTCMWDFVEIRDGDTANSTLIGHYCGPIQAKPDRVLSSFNYLWIRFKTDGSVRNRGFLANYSTVDIGCGGILREKHGVISSPGHPEVYPHGVDCSWIIRGVPGQVIRLNWVSFSLERNPRCSFDSVELYDNSTLVAGNGSLIGRYCGQETPPQVTSSDYTMTIRFKSDHSVAHDGFTANYVLVNASTLCGANYFTQTGMLQSPGYPDPYPRSKNCAWIIKVPIGQQIKLNISDFDVENGTTNGCVYDYLEIRNGEFVTSPLIGRFCGTNLPPRMIPSSSNTIYLKFVTDSSTAGRGFQIFWDGTSTGCGSTLRSPSGSLVSPNYPSSAGTRLECIWNIVVNQGSAIQFTFVDLDISPRCWREFVELRDGPRANSPLLGIGKYCNSESTLAINTTSSTIRVKFVTMGGTGRGFHATYQTICKRQIKGQHSGVIESPNFPDPYPHNRNCSWDVIAPRGNKVNISFSHFSVEDPHVATENCRYDFVEVLEAEVPFFSQNPTPPVPTSLGKFCGNEIPGMISTTKNIAIVHFASDASLARNGFRLEWIVNGCGGKIVGSWGVLKSPNYPRPYPVSVTCEWYIETQLGTRVSLTISDLEMERADQCVFDSVTVYGGPDDTSGQLTQLCQNIPRPATVTAHGNRMFVRFVADSSVSAKGFYGYITQLPAGCGGFFSAPEGIITSPHYPQFYDHNADCGWRITVDSTHVVELEFSDFNVERHINCSYDHVAVYDGYTTAAPLLLMHCGDQLPEPARVRSTGNTIFVRLKTDGSSSNKGFKANYTTGCGARLTGRTRGTINSPGFPHLIYRLNCTWYLSGQSAQDRVTLTFTHLDLQAGQTENCDKDFVEVIDGEDLDAPSLGKFCFSRVPPAITSQAKSLIVRVITTDSWGFGFRANYDISSGACGGDLTSAEGSFISPNFPNGYPPSKECVWTIRASRGNRVALSFRRMDIEASDFCNTDSVEIHERGPSGPLLGHYCGTDIPSNITAAEVLWVFFRSDANGQAPGFLADYTLVHGNELNGSVGTIESPLYPLPFHGLGTYTWRVLVNNSQAIRIRFSAFDFEFDSTTENCENYLKIFDGYDENALQLLYSCDMNLPGVVVSTGNIVQIVLFRNAQRVSSLFQLRWEEVSMEVSRNATASQTLASTNMTGCGGTVSLTAGNDTSLTSPGYPSPNPPGYNSSIRCEWIINSPPGYLVKVKVEDMDLESHVTCAYDGVDVFVEEELSSNYLLNQTLCRRSDQDMILVSSGRTIKIVFRTDPSVGRVGFNLTLSPICGGTIRDTRGRITSPNYPQNYGYSDCVWTVIVRPGRTINVAIRQMDIYTRGQQTECSTDRLILRNGGHVDSPFLGQGRYCGNVRPTSIPETTGNQLYIRFQAFSTQGRGFELIFTEVSVGCGGQIHLTDEDREFAFSSPNYPNVPQPFTECEWVFTVPPHELVRLDFQLNFQFRTSPGCTIEGVEIRNGGTRMSPLLNTFCGTDLPATQRSTENIMYVRYYTNSNEPQIGFKAQASVARCGGTITGYYESVTSPGYPVSYETNLDCLWTLRGPEGNYLNIGFTDLEIGTNQFRPNTTGTGPVNCTRDFLQITEENITGIDNPRTWNFCGVSASGGMAVLPRIQTSTNVVHVRFRSDAISETRKGFKMTFSSSRDQCGGTIQGQPSGTIESPGYPRPYPRYLWCYWRIIAPENRRVRLEFLDFDMEPQVVTPASTSCSDYIYVGQYVGSRKNLWYSYNYMRMYNSSQICGGTLPRPVETTHSYLVVGFRTDATVAHRGFRARFTTELPTICGGDLDGDFGIVTSPLDQTATPNETSSVVCGWSHPGQGDNATTIITIVDLRIPPWAEAGKTPNTCNIGSLRFAMSETNYWDDKGYCGRQSNVKLYLPGSFFQIYYSARHLESSFNLTYQVIGCGGIITQPNGTIESPNFPNPYGTNVECIWKLNFGSGQVQLIITDLQLDDHQDDQGCDRDYLLVRNGLFYTSPLLGKYCGTNIPPPIISMSSGLWIEFHSDDISNGNGRGFRIETQRLDKGCGGVVHRKTGTLQSPRVSYSSSRYPSNVECEWILESVPGYTLNLQFDGRFDLEAQTNCSNDFVEISEKIGTYWSPVGRFCGRQVPPPVNTTTASVRVLFRSNGEVDGDGFTLHWYSVCGGIFREDSGVIRSAHYDRYNHSWHASASSFWSRSYVGWENNHKVQDCYYTIQGLDKDDYIVLKFLPDFDVSVPATSGWRASDLTESCPVVNVTLRQGNKTEVQAGPYSTRFLGRFCGQEVPPNTFIGHGALTLVYNYMAHFETYGFRAEYNIYHCGGEVHEETTIQSPGHPFTSAPNMNCTWKIVAPAGKVVRFKFERMELEYSRLCYYDYVKLFNSHWGNEELKLGTFCGNLTEDIPRIMSTGPVMTVQFVTDHSVEHSGFMGAIDFTIGPEAGCGGRINASSGATQTIRAPQSADGKYAAYLDCQWLIIGPDYQVLDVSFTSFTIQGNQGNGTTVIGDECPYDFVEIRDGPGPSASVLGRFCGSTAPPRLTSSSNFLWINFMSDGSYQFPGFGASISSRPSPCGPSLALNATSEAQILMSPSYPNAYEPNLRCRWIVDGERFHDEVDIRFLELDLEASPDCSKDRLQIRDVSSSYTSPEGIGGPILFSGTQAVEWRFRGLDDIDTATIMKNFKYCGQSTPSDFISVGRSLEILFETDTSGAGRGFKVEYKAAACNRTYDAMQGRVFSPEWPTNSPLYTNCIKTIRGGNGTTISMYFNDFRLEESNGCGESFFEVREGSGSGELHGRFCGTSRPEPIFSTTNVLWINYVTKFLANRGFDFSYTTTTAGSGCGGDLFHTGGSFTSPFYPGNYSQAGDCTWRIRVPAGLKISLSFTSFRISGVCTDTFLEILSMNSHDPSSEPTLFTTYCAGDVPSTYNGDTDMAMVRYKSSVNNTGTGWRIEFVGRQASGSAAAA